MIAPKSPQGRFEEFHEENFSIYEALVDLAFEVLSTGRRRTGIFLLIALEAHLHVDLSAFADGADVDLLVEDLNIAVGLDHAGGDNAGRVGAEVEGLGAVACKLEGNLLQVEDDVGGVLDHSADGLELVQHALDANGGNGCALDRREQSPAEGVAYGGAEAPLKWLG